MKICYISYVPYGNGSWVHTTQFITALKAIHDDLVVYTPRADQGGASDERTLASRYSCSLLQQFREVRLFFAMFFRHIVREKKMLRSEKPDVVILRHGRYFSVVLLCRLLNIPVILEVNGPALEDQFSPKYNQLRGRFFWQWLERKLLAMPNHVMVVSETLRHYYITCGISPQKITGIPNGVDIRNFNPEISGERIRKKLRLQGKTIVGFSGNFAPWHGLDLLADAMKNIEESKEYNDVVLLLIGKPGELFTMPELPDSITVITGHVPHEEMPEYLAAIDIFIAPYPPITPFYFSPLKIFEAMAMGKPVIASAQGQICELIIDQVSGLLYPPGDQFALIRSIESLIANPQLRNELGCRAEKTMKSNFTWKDNARKILQLCHQVVEGK